MKVDRHGIVRFGGLFRYALLELLKNDPLRMAGATAFFTTFALPPILVILIQVFKLIIDPHLIRKELFRNLDDLFGPETVHQLVGVLQGIRRIAQNWYITIGGFVFLLFVATTLFKVIKNSLNQVWKMRRMEKQGLLRSLGSRARSVLVILVAGVLFVIGIVGEGMQTFVGRYVFEISPVLSAYFNTALNYFISIFVVTLWFAIVFRFLPDGRPDWRIAFAGAFVTAILFTMGRALLHWLLTYSNITTLYGTSASIVLLLLFVFYSALILYYGAAFTKVLGLEYGRPIRPVPHAVHYKVIEAEVEQKRDE